MAETEGTGHRKCQAAGDFDRKIKSVLSDSFHAPVCLATLRSMTEVIL